MLTSQDKETIHTVLGHLGMTFNEDATTLALVLDSARVTNNVAGVEGVPLNASQRKIVTKGLRELGIMDAPKYPRPGYREFVEYIAYNDDEEMVRQGDPSVLVSMVAHLFNKDTEVVLKDVRKKLQSL
jgi:hypothetical protein